MTAQLLSWISIGVNVTCAAVNCVLIYRNVKLRKRERQQYDEAIQAMMTDVAPTIAFAVAMRDMPGVPDPVRRFAASVIPKNIEITSGPIPAPSGKVH